MTASHSSFNLVIADLRIRLMLSASPVKHLGATTELLHLHRCGDASDRHAAAKLASQSASLCGNR